MPIFLSHHKIKMMHKEWKKKDQGMLALKRKYRGKIKHLEHHIIVGFLGRKFISSLTLLKF